MIPPKAPKAGDKYALSRPTGVRKSHQHLVSVSRVVEEAIALVTDEWTHSFEPSLRSLLLERQKMFLHASLVEAVLVGVQLLSVLRMGDRKGTGV